MNFKDIINLKPGDEVYWSAPDHSWSGRSTILKIHSKSGEIEDFDTTITLRTHGGTTSSLVFPEQIESIGESE